MKKRRNFKKRPRINFSVFFWFFQVFFSFFWRHHDDNPSYLYPINKRKMSISRQVLTSPFDMPSKPRLPLHSKNSGITNRSVTNIMTDSRVVRRSTFIPTSRPKDDENECVIFDARLLDEKNVFANPIVTVINNGEDHVDGNVVKTNCSVSKVQ